LNKFKEYISYKGIALVLFLFVFSYLLFRIFINGTLHDEIATFMFFIYQGDFKGDTIVWDANNHLLNSFLGHLSYPIFKANISLYRLFNLLGFVIYFWSNYRICSKLNTKYLNILGLITLSTIPFIIEFFGYCRGYGLSLGFFSLTLLSSINFTADQKLKSLILGLAAMLLCISANLTFINTGLLLFLLLLIYLFINKAKFTLKQKSIALILLTLFLLAIIPLIQFAMELKEHGALYYGGNTGFWEITGKSITKYLFFTELSIFKYIYISLFSLFIFKLFQLTKRKKSIFQPYQFLSLLFFGNLIGVFLMAFIFNVNYPEDRTAFYLLILFLFIILFYLDTIKTGVYLQYGLLIFPILFVTKMSLNTSVFYPDDRMTDEFYRQVKKEIKPNHTLMIYPTMNWNWPFKESFQKQKASVALFNNFNSTLSDILITKTTVINNKKIYSKYKVIAQDKDSDYIAFKRKYPLEQIKIIDTCGKPNYHGNEEYINILEHDKLKILKKKDIKISVEGHLKTFKSKNKIFLVVQTFKKNNEQHEYYYYSFETCFQGQKINHTFKHHFLIENFNSDCDLIKIYLWNRNQQQVELCDTKVTINELKESK
jgi:hypothetical protein